jgi:hypothetical protein
MMLSFTRILKFALPHFTYSLFSPAGMTGTLTFIIIPHQFSSPVCDVSPQTATQQTVHVKAHFDYDPEEDLYIPCRCGLCAKDVELEWVRVTVLKLCMR